MTFAVMWKLSAIQELGRIEQAAEDPATIRAAATRMEFALRRMARDLGESRERGFRLWYEDTLGVFYRIDETAMRIEIL
ncbi:MAG TPA: hypothetical protein VLM40_01620 [Gemmata sp.]|nr:hypothetical protein [Gemmata sp.]